MFQARTEAVNRSLEGVRLIDMMMEKRVRTEGHQGAKYEDLLRDEGRT